MYTLRKSKLIVKFLRRNISTKKNLYDVLQLTPKATQVDIKAQYYKLSKMYHPDVNKDNVDAADTFRAITEAYEVLGNYRLRKLYDRGIIHTAGKDYAHHATRDEKTQPYDHSKEDETDDPSVKFYKSRLTRHHTTGSHKIYNFDEWTAGHYGATFQKAQATKRKTNIYTKRETDNALVRESRSTTLGVIIFVAIIIIIAEMTHSNFDTVDPAIVKKDKK